MKTRRGFVSNSSSTSFVVVLSNNLKFEDEDTQEVYGKLIAEGEFKEYKDYVGFQLLSSALSKYVIASFEVGSDAGTIRIADRNKIREILQGKI